MPIGIYVRTDKTRESLSLSHMKENLNPNALKNYSAAQKRRFEDLGERKKMSRMKGTKLEDTHKANCSCSLCKAKRGESV